MDWWWWIFGPDDLQRFLLTSTILWFCECVFLSLFVISQFHLILLQMVRKQVVLNTIIETATHSSQLAIQNLVTLESSPKTFHAEAWYQSLDYLSVCFKNLLDLQQLTLRKISDFKLRNLRTFLFQHSWRILTRSNLQTGLSLNPHVNTYGREWSDNIFLPLTWNSYSEQHWSRFWSSLSKG